MLSIFATRSLIATVSSIMPVGNFITKTFFNREIHSDTRYIDIIVKKGGRKLAPFVSPKIGGKVMKRDGKKLDTYEPPMLKPKYISNAEEIFESNTAFYANSQSPQQRAAENIAEDLADGKDRIYRRIELMATQSIVDGKIIVKGDGVEDEIDFGMDANNKKVLTGTSLWSDPASDPISDLTEWSEYLFTKSGKTPDIVILGRDAANAFLRNQKVIDAFDKKDIERGKLEPKPLEDGVGYIGYIGDVNLKLYKYIDMYEDDDGVVKEILDPKKLIMGSTRTEAHIAFGGIADMKALANAGISGQIFVGSIFAKAYEIPDPSQTHILLQSKPLPIPTDMDSFLSAEVTA